MLFHAYGLGNALTFPYWAGAATVLLSRAADAAGRSGDTYSAPADDVLRRCRPSTTRSSTTRTSARYDLSSIRLCISAAEPLPPETWRRWKEAFGLTILDGIGSTEMLHIFCSNTPERAPARVERQAGARLRAQGRWTRRAGRSRRARSGTCYVKGDSARALLLAPARQEPSTRCWGEWVVTGDRYRVDEDGFYWYEGRSDDMIKVGGEWVSPIEIENVLLEHPAVREVAVVGTPVEGIMRIKAAVVLASDHEPSPALVAELQDWCKTRLQRYQYPAPVDFVDELPKTVTGKIQRFKLREAAG